MLAAIKLEVMTPAVESPDEGCIGICPLVFYKLIFLFVVLPVECILLLRTAIDFHMPPICSPIVRPGRPAEVAPVVAKQLSDTILRQVITTFIHLHSIFLFEKSPSDAFEWLCKCLNHVIG